MENESSLITLDSLYHIGDFVEIQNNGIKAWILDIDHDEMECSIRYQIGGTIETAVPLSSLRVVSAISNTDNRSGQVRNHSVPPSVQSSLQNTPQAIPDTPRIAALKEQYQNLKIALRSSYAYANTPRSISQPHPLYTFLQQRTNLPKGWIRDVIDTPPTTAELYESNRNVRSAKKQLSPKQNRVFITALTMFSPTSAIGGIFKGWQKLVNFAFDVSPKKASRSIDNFINDGFNRGIITLTHKR